MCKVPRDCKSNYVRQVQPIPNPLVPADLAVSPLHCYAVLVQLSLSFQFSIHLGDLHIGRVERPTTPRGWSGNKYYKFTKALPKACSPCDALLVGQGCTRQLVRKAYQKSDCIVSGQMSFVYAIYEQKIRRLARHKCSFVATYY